MNEAATKRTRVWTCRLGIAVAVAVLATSPVQAQGTAYAGGAGGQPFVRMCPAGFALAGFSGRSGQFLNSLQLRCRAVDDTGGWAPGQPEIMVAVGGEGGDGRLSPVDCPRDEFVTGLRVTHGAFVHGFRPRCQDSQGRVSDIAYFGDEGTLENLGGVGEFVGGTRQETLACPAGRPARGVVGRSGKFVDAMRLECAPGSAADLVEDTPQEVGRVGILPGGGGDPFATECGSGERMVGLVSREESSPGVWLRSLTPICAEPGTWDREVFAQASSLLADPTTRARGEALRRTVARFGARVGAGGANRTFLLCPSGQFAAGAEVRHEDFINGIRLRCRSLDGVNTGSTGLAGSARGRRDILQCPGDMTASGLVGRAGSAIDALRLRCRLKTAPIDAPRLFAIFGDSYAAGEGAPDIVVGTDLAPFQGESREDRAGWIDRMCHRSERGGMLQAARALQNEVGNAFDLRTFACSGAEIQDGFVSVQSDPPEAGAPTDPQLDQAERWMSDREAGRVDAVLISLGGNDAGFARRIADCIGGEVVEDLLVNLLPFDCALDPGFRRLVADEPAKLPGLYDLLATQLQRVNPRRVYIRGYPDALRSPRDYCQAFQDPGEEPPLQPSLSNLPANAAYNNLEGITREVSELVDTAFVQVVNGHMLDAARRHGWIPIMDWYEATRGHGFCADERWFNIPSEAFRNQGNSGGVFHPNELGYRSEADVITRVLSETWLPPRPVNIALARATAPLVSRTGDPTSRIARPVRDALQRATYVRGRRVTWTIQGPETDLDILYRELAYQVGLVTESPRGIRSSSSTVAGHRETGIDVPAPLDAWLTDVFVRSCEGSLCSGWSEGIRVVHQSPGVPLRVAVTPPGSGARLSREMRITWTDPEAAPARGYQLAYATQANRRFTIQAIGEQRPRGPRQRNGTSREAVLPVAGSLTSMFMRACNAAGCSDWAPVALPRASSSIRPGRRVGGAAPPEGVEAPRFSPIRIAQPRSDIQAIQLPR